MVTRLTPNVKGIKNNISELFMTIIVHMQFYETHKDKTYTNWERIQQTPQRKLPL